MLCGASVLFLRLSLLHLSILGAMSLQPLKIRGRGVGGLFRGMSSPSQGCMQKQRAVCQLAIGGLGQQAGSCLGTATCAACGALGLGLYRGMQPPHCTWRAVRCTADALTGGEGCLAGGIGAGAGGLISAVLGLLVSLCSGQGQQGAGTTLQEPKLAGSRAAGKPVAVHQTKCRPGRLA